MLNPDTPLLYSVDRLLSVFTAARDGKQAHVNDLKIGKPDGLGNWAAEWPGGNARIEQKCVDALQAWKDAGVAQVQTAFVLSDADPAGPAPEGVLGNIHHSFFMQLTANQIKPVQP
ncbi:MAG: hypothetical protein NDJ24_01500 [Alphaproteobacteria bacterium]|nr:hypothetical protein [Alphaproteobacteria bacterium]